MVSDRAAAVDTVFEPASVPLLDREKAPTARQQIQGRQG